MLLNSRLTSSPAGLLQRQTLAVYAAKGFGAGKTKKAGKVGRQPVLTCRAAAAAVSIRCADLDCVHRGLILLIVVCRMRAAAGARAAGV